MNVFISPSFQKGHFPKHKTHSGQFFPSTFEQRAFTCAPWLASSRHPLSFKLSRQGKCCFSLVTFKTLSWGLVFRCLMRMCLSTGFSEFILWEVHLHSWFCGFICFPKLRGVQLSISLNPRFSAMFLLNFLLYLSVKFLLHSLHVVLELLIDTLFVLYSYE